MATGRHPDCISVEPTSRTSRSGIQEDDGDENWRDIIDLSNAEQVELDFVISKLNIEVQNELNEEEAAATQKRIMDKKVMVRTYIPCLALILICSRMTTLLP